MSSVKIYHFKNIHVGLFISTIFTLMNLIQNLILHNFPNGNVVVKKKLTKRNEKQSPNAAAGTDMWRFRKSFPSKLFSKPQFSHTFHFFRYIIRFTVYINNFVLNYFTIPLVPVPMAVRLPWIQFSKTWAIARHWNNQHICTPPSYMDIYFGLCLKYISLYLCYVVYCTSFM